MKEEHLLGGFLEPTNEGYALAKISGMKLCEYYNQQHGTNYLSLITCNLYGEGDHFETEGSHVISALLYRMHQAKIQGDTEVVVWGTGNTRREFLFVDDFSKAILHFVGKVDAKQMQGFVNVGSGKDQSIRDLAYMVKEVVGYPGELTFDATKPDGMPKKLMSITRAHDLGWKHETEIRDGLEVAYQWYLQNGADEIAKDTANI